MPAGTLEQVLSAERTWCVLHGDSARLLCDVPENVCDAAVIDPPSGIGFMGKDWDGDKGGMREWIQWLAEDVAPVVFLPEGVDCTQNDLLIAYSVGARVPTESNLQSRETLIRKAATRAGNALALDRECRVWEALEGKHDRRNGATGYKPVRWVSGAIAPPVSPFSGGVQIEFSRGVEVVSAKVCRVPQSEAAPSFVLTREVRTVRGELPIPYVDPDGTAGIQFEDPAVASAAIVRVAVHPEVGENGIAYRLYHTSSGDIVVASCIEALFVSDHMVDELASSSA